MLMAVEESSKIDLRMEPDKAKIMSPQHIQVTISGKQNVRE